MGQSKITFYVDVISPFGYMGYWMLRNSPVFKDAQISYVPIVLGGLHKQCGITPPIVPKNKKEWIGLERTRWAEIFSIPMRQDPPPEFPFSTIAFQRALTALYVDLDAGSSPKGMATFAEALDVCWAAVWCPESDVLTSSSSRKEAVGKLRNAKGTFDLKSVDTVKGLFAAAVGADVAEKCMKRSADKDVKDQLVKFTGESFDAGAFGIPWFACTNEKGEREGFWGFDHMGLVVRFLGLDQSGDKDRSGQTLRALL